MPDAIGSHWSRQVVRELIEGKGPIVHGELPDKGAGWTLHYAVFACAGFTDAAIAELTARQGLAIDLPMLEAGLTVGTSQMRKREGLILCETIV